MTFGLGIVADLVRRVAVKVHPATMTLETRPGWVQASAT